MTGQQSRIVLASPGELHSNRNDGRSAHSSLPSTSLSPYGVEWNRLDDTPSEHESPSPPPSGHGRPLHHHNGSAAPALPTQRLAHHYQTRSERTHTYTMPTRAAGHCHHTDGQADYSTAGRTKLVGRPHGDCVWRNRLPRPLHCEPTGTSRKHGGSALS